MSSKEKMKWALNFFLVIIIRLLQLQTLAEQKPSQNAPVVWS